VMMIVMPAFTQGDQCQQWIVAAGVRRVISATAEHVVQRIDRYGRVQQYCGGDEKPPGTSSAEIKVVQCAANPLSFDPFRIWIRYLLRNQTSAESMSLADG